jgi:tight adherence protein B
VEEVLDHLAGLIRCGLPLRTALSSLPEAVDASERDAALATSRYLRLGGSTEGGLRKLLESCGVDGTLAPVLAGGRVEPAGVLSSLARQVKERRAATATARAAAAGARLSGRLVASLPLMFLPLAPVAQAPVWDVGGALLLAMGGMLAIAGLRWIDRFVPTSPRADLAGTFADLIAALLRGGAGTSQALHAAALCRGPTDAAVAQARQKVLLGASWELALSGSGGSGYRTLAMIVRRGRLLGLDIAADLEAFARMRRAQCSAVFDAEIKKAPIKMVVPLVTCVLPAFVIVSFGPFFRSIF